MWLRFLGFPLALAAGVAAAAVFVLGLVIVLAYPNLPELNALTAYQPKIPLRIYSADGVLIGEFGEERRAVGAVADLPIGPKNPIIAAADRRFYHHTAIDYVGGVAAAPPTQCAGSPAHGARTL